MTTLSRETLSRLARDILGPEVEPGEHAEVLREVQDAHEVLERIAGDLDLSKSEPAQVYRPKRNDSVE